MPLKACRREACRKLCTFTWGLQLVVLTYKGMCLCLRERSEMALQKSIFHDDGHSGMKEFRSIYLIPILGLPTPQTRAESLWLHPHPDPNHPEPRTTDDDDDDDDDDGDAKHAKKTQTANHTTPQEGAEGSHSKQTQTPTHTTLEGAGEPHHIKPKTTPQRGARGYQPLRGAEGGGTAEPGSRIILFPVPGPLRYRGMPSKPQTEDHCAAQ